jgi:ankyrin repeat protein
LIERGVPVTTSRGGNETPLHIAACQPLPALVALLLKHGADINARTTSPAPSWGISTGDTPLHAAVRKGMLENVELLLDKVADIKAETDEKQDALELAVASGNVAMAALLLKRGALPNRVCSTTHTPLLLVAVKAGNVKMAEALLDHKAAIEAKTPLTGETSLYIAVASNNTDMINLFYKYGANMHAAADNGQTPLQLSEALCVAAKQRNLTRAQNNEAILASCLYGFQEQEEPLVFPMHARASPIKQQQMNSQSLPNNP